MAKLVSFNSLDELRTVLSSNFDGSEALTLSVLGARDTIDPSKDLDTIRYFTSIAWAPEPFFSGSIYILYFNRGSVPRLTEVTSSNFSTYFPSGGMLVI